MEYFEKLDHLLSRDPYSIEKMERESVLLELLNDSYRHHFDHCEPYRNFALSLGYDRDRRFERVQDVPYLHVQAFKQFGPSLRTSSIKDDKAVLLQSSATSGVPSTVVLDGTAARRQVKALAGVLSRRLGAQRRPFLVFDVNPREASPQQIGARGAAVKGYLNLARSVEYLMEAGPNGEMKLNLEKTIRLLEAAEAQGEPIVLMGFTYMLYLHGLVPLMDAQKKFRLPTGSQIIHIGGWKKLENQKVSKTRFNESFSSTMGVPFHDVIDFYGFTEQMGINYPDDSQGLKIAPAFADVIVRDPNSLAVLPDGQEGVLQFVTPLTTSYPGFSVLTDDIGRVVSRDSDADGMKGTRFVLLGRAKKAEARGCGDILADKVYAATARAQEAEQTPDAPRLLFSEGRSHVTFSMNDSVDLKKLPIAEDLKALSRDLLKAREKLDSYTIDELIMLLDAAADSWLKPGSDLAPLRTEGLQFISSWCRASRLRESIQESLRAPRTVLDGPVGELQMGRRALFAAHRGLAVHWLAGNVPLLGMLCLSQSILTRNANILKAPSTFSSVIPALLDHFRGLEIKTKSRKILRGQDILDTIAVVYYPKENLAAANSLSEAADVRIAWGGREAVEAIMNLPRRFGTEDIILGPKLSYMVVGNTRLMQASRAEKTARMAAVDASVFDQYACASPHTIFVQEGGVVTPAEFAERLAYHMERVSKRIPKAPIDAGTSSKIQGERLKSRFTNKRVWASEGTTWTVIYDDDKTPSLATPCYSRVITVKPARDLDEIAHLAHAGIQTIGLAMSNQEKDRFARIAARRGAERFPDLGRMTYFDSPWDGMFVMNRLVRWTSIGGPY